MAVTIYYDGDCPFCAHYVRDLRLAEAAGTPRLVDLREAALDRAWLQREGFDLDESMVVEIDGRRYGGGDAVHALALLSTGSGWFNRLNALILSNRCLARLGYPLLRAVRNATLLCLGRQPIRADDGESALFLVFSLFFALFGAMHFLIYAIRYQQAVMHPSTWALLPLSVLLFLRPGSKLLFVLLALTMAADSWAQAPMASNHTILKNFFLLGVLAAGLYHWLRGSSWSRFFADIVPVGQALLVLMYVFGIFHKINEGFLDPAVSCAVTLWRLMPLPLRLLDGPLIHDLTIYGTFLAEGAIILLLLVPATRHWGIVAGMGFHMLLALSGFAMYPAFSSLSLALHTLFLSPEAAHRVVASPLFGRILRVLHSPAGWMMLLSVLVLMAWAALLRDYATVGLFWLLLVGPPAAAILLYGRCERGDRPSAPILWSRLRFLNVIGLLFLLNGAMPYLGLKSAQAINMFANLRLEGGYSNHLVLRGAPGPFGYLDDVVAIEAAEGSRYLEYIVRNRMHLVYYALLDRLEREPHARVTYTRANQRFENVDAAALADEIEQTLHPRWVRKYFHFTPVDLTDAPRCR